MCQIGCLWSELVGAPACRFNQTRSSQANEGDAHAVFADAKECGRGHRVCSGDGTAFGGAHQIENQGFGCGRRHENGVQKTPMQGMVHIIRSVIAEDACGKRGAFMFSPCRRVQEAVRRRTMASLMRCTAAVLN